jgi:3-keto-disaccharide hydrolase
VITRLSLLVLVAGLQIAKQTVEAGFTSLFNGKDFTGWKISGPTETFTIQDGAIVAKGAASHAYYDGGFRSHSFLNFELKVDIMTRAGSNGGVYILTEFQAIGGNASASGPVPFEGL